MNEHRCLNCNKLLFKGHFIGIIEIMCNRCKKINKIECQHSQQENNMI